jgi:phage-related protein
MSWNPLRRARERREAELEAVDRWRIARRVADEDVTVLGEQLADLHLDTLTDHLDDETAHHYGRALEHYEQAKDAVRASTTVEDVFAVEQVVADARYHRAAVLALQAGDPLPQRREPCFFDPRHGPSMRDKQWAPPSGVERTVAVCAADARRLEGGEQPQVRMVRVGDRYVPSHEAGGIAAVVDRHRTMRDERSTSHNRKNLAEAYMDQAINGANGPGGPFGG